MNKIYTVKDLKEFLNKLPDEAFVYEQETLEGKHLEAISPYYSIDSNGKSFQSWSFPELPIVPMTSEFVIDYLNKVYNNEKV